MTLARYRLGEVLIPTPRPVRVDPEARYTEIGIRSHGKGIFHKSPVVGLELGNKKVLRIEPGDFVLNIVFAWEGAVAIAADSEAGTIGSHRFPTYRVREELLEPRYLLHYLRTPAGLEMLLRVSPGGAGRNRTLNRQRFLAQEIAVPPREEQSRIVALIDRVSTGLDSAQRERASAQRDLNALRGRLVESLIPAASSDDPALGDLVKVQSGYAFKSEWFSDDGIRLLRNVNVAPGVVSWASCVRLPASRRDEFAAFELSEGDIVLSLDRPLISSGLKVARLAATDVPSLLLQRVARMTMRSEHLLPQYLFEWFNSPHFSGAIDPGRSNGVPHISPVDVARIRIHVPTKALQERIVAQVSAVRVRLDQARTLLEDAWMASERMRHATLVRLLAAGASTQGNAFGAANSVVNHGVG